MIRTAKLDDLPDVRALFARANDAPYDLAAVAEEKVFGSGVAGEPHVRIFGDVQGVAVTCGRYLRILAVNPEARGRGIGTALLRDAEELGATVIAAEPGNYFTPGIVDSDATTIRFLQNRGYAEKAATHNLVALLECGGNAAALKAEAMPPHSTTRRPSPAEAEPVLAFIGREFGRIWRFEAAKAFDTAIPQILITEDGPTITGFAAYDVNNRGLGFFGPTGIARDLRGRGLGCRLLLDTLSAMHDLGYARAVIPWTDALAFYRKCCGAEPAHRFVAFAKPQP